MTEKKKVSKPVKKVEKKKPVPSKKKKPSRGRPKGSKVKRRKKSGTGFAIPMGKPIDHQFAVELVEWINNNSKSKKTAGAATDGKSWWFAFV